jgi:succinyldiaminopimelate transaminase
LSEPSHDSGPAGFVPPAYPYDRLDAAQAKAAALEGGLVDLSIGTPCDPPSAAVVAALAGSNAERGYPASIGSAPYREAAVAWIARRFGVELDRTAVAACVGTKEFVATLPHLLKLRTPARDTVLYPAVAYPTYEMGAILAGCRAVAVPVDDRWRLDLTAIDDADVGRALCLWANTPGNPAGGLDDLTAVAAWGQAHGVPVFSDECYAEFTWDGSPRSILEHGTDGLVAVHSLSKRSNLAGVRAGFYAGDGDLVHYLSEVRKHMGMMVPGPVQAAAVAALDDDAHVKVQRDVYLERLQSFAGVLGRWADTDVALPSGGFYLWMPAPGGAWGFTDRLATEGGALVSPGEFYGEAGATHVRVAMVQPQERLDLVARRLGVAG